MPSDVRVLTALIASPGDVRHHREAIANEVAGLNRSPLAKVLGFRIDEVRWELDAVPQLGRGDGQEVINQQLAEPADIIIGVFHSRLGTRTARAVSGTAEEIASGVERKIPVHVYRDTSPPPEGHDPEQLGALEAYLKSIRGDGLVATFESDAELARQVRLALEHDVAELVSQSTRSGEADTNKQPASRSLRECLFAAADTIFNSEVFADDVQFDGTSEWASEAHERRQQELLTACRPLLEAAVEAIRSRDVSANETWLELIPSLAPNPFAGGLKKLVDQKRAPGALLLHTAGVAACAQRDDRLVGHLLSANLRVNDPYQGLRPAIVSLRPELVVDGAWPSQALRELVLAFLGDAFGSRRLVEQAWEEWAYLTGVAITYFRDSLDAVWAEYPYLSVSGAHVGTLTIEVAAQVRSRFGAQASAHPALVAGFCEGAYELFQEAAKTFEANYGHWADRRDWAALPPGGGALPSAPHYPGQRRGR